MTRWTNVRWTEAGQLAGALGWKQMPADEARKPPEAFTQGLRSQGKLTEAVQFVAQALPRFEAVAWAARAVRDLPRTGRPGEAETAAIRSTLLWVQDPTDHRRRAARAAADAIPEAGPERLAALAAFYSGGSLAPEGPGQQPVPAPKEMTGRFAAGAVLMAAYQCEDAKAALQAALDMGEIIAAGGLAAENA